MGVIMLKTIFIIMVYLLDYWAGRAFYALSYLSGKTIRARNIILSKILPLPCLSETLRLRQEILKLQYANNLMRRELNRIKQKKPCLCKKLQMIYFKLRFGVSLRKISRYLPISRTAVINYLNQLRLGISNLLPRTRGYHNSPNRTPVSIAELIYQIHQDNPHWGRWKIALSIWKIGVYVSPSTVRNILNVPKPDYRRPETETKIKLRSINGKYPNHVWSIDLTTVYIFLRPLYILAVLDHYSRKALVLASTFNPTAGWVVGQLKVIAVRYGRPKHLISDHGGQFIAGDFKEYLRTNRICHRYGQVGRANSNGKIERFFLSLKYEFLNLYFLFSKPKTDGLLKDYLIYYNEHRPHEALDGQIPDEIYFRRPRDKPPKDAKTIKGTLEQISFGDGLLKAYRLKKTA